MKEQMNIKNTKNKTVCRQLNFVFGAPSVQTDLKLFVPTGASNYLNRKGMALKDFGVAVMKGIGLT